MGGGPVVQQIAVSSGVIMRVFPTTFISSPGYGLRLGVSAQTACPDRKTPLPHPRVAPWAAEKGTPFGLGNYRDSKNFPFYLLTNIYSSPLTAYVIEIIPVPNGQEQHIGHGFRFVDLLTDSAELRSPIPRGLSTMVRWDYITGEPIRR